MSDLTPEEKHTAKRAIKMMIAAPMVMIIILMVLVVLGVIGPQNVNLMFGLMALSLVVSFLLVKRQLGTMKDELDG